MARKDNSGYISKETRPKTKEEQRDYRGSALIGGIDYWISGWDNVGEDGEYIGLKFNRKDDSKKEHSEQKANAYQPKQPTYVNQEDVKTSSQDDDQRVPF